MSRPAIRVNARLTGEDARLFRDVQKLEKQSASGLLRAAVREYSRKRVKPRRDAYRIMQDSGFIGCAAGPPDLSVRYKEYLKESLIAEYESSQRRARK